MKKMILALTLLCSLNAQAALNVSCSIWSNDADIALTVQMILPFTIGGTLDDMPLGISRLTVIDKAGDEDQMVFHDAVSWMNTVSSRGYWRMDTKTLFPINGADDIANPKPVETPMRRLAMNFELKGEEEGDPAPALSEFQIDVMPSTPGDATYIGHNKGAGTRVVYNGVTYEGDSMRTNCSVYISVRDANLN